MKTVPERDLMGLTGLTDLTDLSLLLEHLRLRGIVVGAPELQRLQSVFAHTPVLSHAALRDLLCHLLAKDAHQRHVVRSSFERLVARDMRSVVPALPASGLPMVASQTLKVDDADETPPAPPKPPPNFVRASLLALLIALAVILFFIVTKDGQERPDSAGDDAPGEPPLKPITETKPAVESVVPELTLVAGIELWTPLVGTAEERALWPELLPGLLLLLGAGSGFVYLLAKAQQKTRQRIPRAPLTPKGAGRSWLPGMKGQAFRLLSGQERRAIAWGIGQRFNERPLRHLDIQKTVRQSAQQALPQIVFQPSRRTREVWLWQERNSHNPDLAQLVDEIERTLRAVNIVVQRAYFRGVPSQPITEQGKMLRDLEPHWQQVQPLLLVFLDAELLAQYQQSRAVEAEKTLYQLGRWPQTAAVDAGGKQGLLAHHLKPYGLTCLLPAAVARWLMQQRKTQAALHPDSEQLLQWAVACAVPPRVVLEEEARALHDELGLAVNWHYAELTRYNARASQELEFGQQRIPLLNQFARALHRAADAPGWTQTVLDFWRRRYTAIDAQLSADEKSPTGRRRWQGTHEQQRQIQLGQALLQLWQAPIAAAEALYNLHEHEKIKADVEQALRAYRFADQPEVAADEQHIITLPQPWDALPTETQRQLLACGLGQPARSLKTQADRFTRSLLGVLAGLALVGLAASLYAVYPRAAAFQLVPNSPAPVAARVTQAWPQAGAYVVGAVKSVFKTAQGLEWDHQVPLRWVREFVPAQQALDEVTQLWRLGSQAQVRRPTLAADQGRWPDWSIAVIAAEHANDPTLQQLAAKLLDTGSVDQVILGKHWQATQAELQAAAQGLETQWLYINGANPSVLHHPHHPAARIATFDHASTLLDRLNQVTAIQTATELGGRLWNPSSDAAARVWLRSEKTYPVAKNRAEIPLANGMQLVRIPAGSFQMGSDQSDDEKPVQTVTLPHDFYMSQTEVTFAQYDAYVEAMQAQANSAVSQKIEVPALPDDQDWGRGDRPVINVSWEDTQPFLRWLSETQQAELQGLECRLPSEAEWEYAARARTQTVYPWGDEASHDAANYGKDECCEGLAEGKDRWVNTAPVGSFPPNEFGLQDMHGNVYEWVQDCYADSYQNAPVNGSAWETAECSGRVLRGGSWYDSAFYLRSADRFNLFPDYRNNDIGFRVVCSSPSGR